MAERQRTSWQGSGDKAASESQPVLPVERARAASAHPATPDEGAAHPAHQPDPTQPADYENGTTESWAEDPTTGPYPNSAHPATPDEGAGHPAHRQTETAPNEPGGEQITNEDLGVSKAAAKELRAAVERKAAKCIRISAVLLGPKALVAAVEDQALDFMDMSDSAIVSTLNRLAEDKDEDEDEDKKASDDKDEEDDKKSAAEDKDDDEDGKKAADEALLRRLVAEEEDEDEDGKEASQDLSASDQILAAIAGLGTRIDALETGKTSTSDDEVLAGLLAEEDKEAMEPVEEDIEAMLYSMIDEPMEPAAMEDPMAMDEPMDEVAPGELGIDMGLVEDPMGLLGDVTFEDDEEELLASLFADSRFANDDDDDDDKDKDDDGDDEEEEEEEDDDKEAKKATSRKPRPKKASRGTPRLGRVAKETASEIRELEKLWPSAPDITGVF